MFWLMKGCQIMLMNLDDYDEIKRLAESYELIINIINKLKINFQ